MGQGAVGFDGRRLRVARRAAGLTQRELARRLRTTDTVVALWETGRRAPLTDRLPELARVVGVRPADLLAADADGAAGAPATLAQLRELAGMLQQQLADRAGLVRRTYSALERGEIATLSPRDADALAAALGVEPTEVRAAHASGRAAFLRRMTDH
jgi:transcriptional regulator with XRE-family HTH domain